MYEAQHGQCKICNTFKMNRGRGRLVIDHCHSTGDVRGLLCHSCNVGLGFFRDNPKFLESAATYLGG
jgi:hypothetical protein